MCIVLPFSKIRFLIKNMEEAVVKGFESLG